MSAMRCQSILYYFTKIIKTLKPSIPTNPVILALIAQKLYPTQNYVILPHLSYNKREFL